MAMKKAKTMPKLDLIWTRPKKPARDPVLNREQIVHIAIRVADAEGLQAITMRRVAAELRVGPMSLYYHIPTKNDLLDLMMDTIYREMEFPNKPSGDWRTDLRLAAHQAGDVARRHLWLMPLLAERPPLGPNFLHHFEFFLAALDGQGITLATMAEIANAMDNYIIGFVLSESRQKAMKQNAGVSDEEWSAAIASNLQRLIATGKYPTIARLINEASITEPSNSFEFGLDCLLEGIAARISYNH